eukprot:scaffold79653_cov58-Phaeocystis_antarctica.AAC.2
MRSAEQARLDRPARRAKLATGRGTLEGQTKGRDCAPLSAHGAGRPQGECTVIIVECAPAWPGRAWCAGCLSWSERAPRSPKQRPGQRPAWC